MLLFRRLPVRPFLPIRPLVPRINCIPPFRLFSVIPPKPRVKDWSTSEVLQWASKIPGLKEPHIRKLEEQEITGRSLFDLNEERLEKYGIPGGPRIEILKEIEKLKEGDPEEMDRLIEEWKKESDITPRDLISPFGLKMPVVQRSEEVLKSWHSIKEHYCGWKNKITDRIQHPRCFAYGPPGSGKTKFGVELISLLKSYGKQLVANDQATNEDKELLELLENSVFIHITFANGNALRKKEIGNIEMALIVRAIRNLFNLSIPLDVFYNRYENKLNSWNISTLQMVAKEFCQTGRTPLIFIHLDEFNHLYNEDPKIFKEAVTLLSSPLCSPVPGVFYFVLFTGTAYTEMKQLGVSESYPLVSIPMKILDREGMYQTVSIMHTDGHLPWLNSSWKQNTPFVLCLLNTGGLPRGLEYFLTEVQKFSLVDKINIDQMTTSDLQQVNNSAETRLLTRYQNAFIKSLEVYGEALALGILGETIYSLTSPLLLDKKETYSSLLSTGSILLKSVGTDLWKIHLPILWFRQYVHKLGLSFLPRSISGFLTSIDQGSWNNWERVSWVILMLRINSIKILNRPFFRMSDIFPGAKGPEELLSREFITMPDYYECKVFPTQFLRNTEKILEDDNNFHLFETRKVWLNGLHGPCFDLWTVFQNKMDTTPIRHTIIFGQCKFSSQDKPLSTMDIINAYDELQERWIQLLQKSKTSFGKLENYDVVFVVLSNRDLSYNHGTDAKSINSLSKCIIYDRNNRIDPFLGTFSTRFEEWRLLDKKINKKIQKNKKAKKKINKINK